MSWSEYIKTLGRVFANEMCLMTMCVYVYVHTRLVEHYLRLNAYYFERSSVETTNNGFQIRGPRVNEF